MSEASSSGLAALQKLVEEEEKKAGIARLPAPRDFVPCNFCGGGPAGGRGCMACFVARQKKQKELEEEYKRQFPDGPKPIFTADRNDPAQMEQLKRVFGREILEREFGPGGGGMEAIMKLADEEMAKRPQEESR